MGAGGLLQDVDLALCRLCVKLHNCTPDQLGLGLRSTLQAWLSSAGLDILQVCAADVYYDTELLALMFCTHVLLRCTAALSCWP